MLNSKPSFAMPVLYSLFKYRAAIVYGSIDRFAGDSCFAVARDKCY